MPSKAAPTAPTYDPETRYAVTLTRVVSVDGFVIRPGPVPVGSTVAEPPVLSGALLNAIAAAEPGAISVARELPPERELPATPPQVHEDAEGVVTVVNGPEVV